MPGRDWIIRPYDERPLFIGNSTRESLRDLVTEITNDTIVNNFFDDANRHRQHECGHQKYRCPFGNSLADGTDAQRRW